MPASPPPCFAQAGLTGEVLAAIEHLVVGCGGFARELLAYTAGDSALKDDTGQRLSAADLLLDQLLRERLTTLLPGSCGYSEEAGHFGSPHTGLQVRWLIDPLDGTRPATLGGAYAISVGALLMEAGMPVAAAGWVYVPPAVTLYRGLLASEFSDCRRNGLPARAGADIGAADLRRRYLAVGSDWHTVPASDCPLKLTAPGATAVHLAQLVHPGSDLAATALSRYRSYDAAGGLVVAVAGGCRVYSLPADGWRPQLPAREALGFLAELETRPSEYAPRALVTAPAVAELLL